MSSSASSNTPFVTRELLEHNARLHPALVLLKFDSGEHYNSVELLAVVQQHAAGLQALGVNQDDPVLSWLPNGPLAVLVWLALNYLGAVYVPINTAYKGRLLQHVINNSGARLLIADGTLVERLALINTGKLRQVVVAGSMPAQLPGLEFLPASTLSTNAAGLQPPSRTIQPWDTQCVIFTSGTTGPSKGVLCSYRHTFTAAQEFRHVGPGDCNLVALPMFHIGGVLGINFALIHAGTAAVVKRFRTETFWDTVRELEVTAVGLLGTMVQFLMQQPVRADEKQHSIRTAVIAPFGDEALAFAERFNIQVFTEFNMTELSVPLWAGPNPAARHSCGQPRAGVELRLVDAFDNEVAAGGIGELLIRTAEPWTMSHGYLNDAAATAQAWRNGWFHTGDLFRYDNEQNYFFVDRVKDMIRRRGENISSFEVEAELLFYPGVKAAAAVAVPGDGGEDEVLAVLAPQAGVVLDPTAITAFLQPRMAAFMMPRYIRIVSDMPLTPSQKIEKHVLRAQGITEDTWDRGNSRAAGKRNTSTDNPAISVEPGFAVPVNAGPLAGIKVVEFAGLGPAPFCCMLLSDMGASVTRIDRPGTVYKAADVEARGRTSVQLDLKTVEGNIQALALLQQADILIEGFRPGVMERLGLGPDIALQHNPRLVYGRMTGWGQSGPLAHKAGHDLNYLAITGALHALGTRDKPAVPLNLIADFGGGALYLAMGVLAALQHAQKTGQGQVVDSAMTDGVISMMSMIYGDFADGRWVDQRESNVIDGAAPFYNVYQCKDDKWLSLAAIEQQFYTTFLEVAQLDDAVLKDQWNRALWPQQQQHLQNFFRTRTRDEWCQLLEPHDVCIAPVLSLSEARAHPHNLARAAFMEKDGIPQPAPAPRFFRPPWQ